MDRQTQSRQRRRGSCDQIVNLVQLGGGTFHHAYPHFIELRPDQRGASTSWGQAAVAGQRPLSNETHAAPVPEQPHRPGTDTPSGRLIAGWDVRGAELRRSDDLHGQAERTDAGVVGGSCRLRVSTSQSVSTVVQ